MAKQRQKRQRIVVGIHHSKPSGNRESSNNITAVCSQLVAKKLAREFDSLYRETVHNTLVAFLRLLSA